MSAREWRGEELRLSMRTHITHVICENRLELGMEELEGRPAAVRRSRQILGTLVRETEQGVLRMTSGEAQLPSAADGSRTLRRSEWKSPSKRVPRTLAGILE